MGREHLLCMDMFSLSITCSCHRIIASGDDHEMLTRMLLCQAHSKPYIISLCFEGMAENIH